MSTKNTIQRNKERKTTNSIESAHMQHPYAVQDAAVPGARNLAEATKLINQKGFSKVIENATVLEIISPPNNPGGKTKYILPHLNLADGATFEGYLCKIRLPEDVGCLPDPQDILDEINSGPSAKKAVEGANPADEKIKRINYFERVANHKTFAPLEPKNQKIPAPNSKVRVICFSEPHMYSGGSIEGFYEVIDNNDELFEQGTLNDLLASFRQFYEGAKAIVQAGSDNISSFVQQNSSEPNTMASEITGIFGNVSDYSWPPSDINAQHIGNPSSPSADKYSKVINQFNVDTNPRYKIRPINGGTWSTFCNLFVADLTWAMGTPVPFKVDENGNPQPMSAKSKQGWQTLGATSMLNWLSTHGLRYGWKEVAPQQAQENANKGILTVAAATGHISIVRPGISRTYKNVTDPKSAQAGASNFNDRYVSNGYGSIFPQYFSCFNNERYVLLSKEQKQL